MSDPLTLMFSTENSRWQANDVIGVGSVIGWNRAYLNCGLIDLRWVACIHRNGFARFRLRGVVSGLGNQVGLRR